MPRSEPTSATLLLRIPEAASLIGFSTRWLQERIAAGKVPTVNVEGRVRMRRTDVEAFARDGKWPDAKCTKLSEKNPAVAKTPLVLTPNKRITPTLDGKYCG